MIWKILLLAFLFMREDKIGTELKDLKDIVLDSYAFCEYDNEIYGPKTC
jgi:hypothetical protein